MSYSNSENEFIDILKYMKKDVKVQIDLIREKAKKLKKDIEDYGKYNILDSYNQTQYYNNISILGGRGSGKTSFLLDLRSDLIKNSKKNSDIIFDIITPDIRDKEDILGWIISLLIKIAKKIKEDKDKNDNIRCNICKEQTKLDKCIYELKQAYFFRKNIHENIIANDYSSKIDYLNDNEEKLNADVDLKGKFKNLVDEIIVLLSDNNEFTPLLIFMFDDVDIHANKINEVLSVIMMYLSHPNIISLIAGDYESAEENITLSMLEEDNILKAQLTKQKINKYDLLTIRKNRSRDFLKKILPPVYRHYINGLDNETKYNIVIEYLVKPMEKNEHYKDILKKIEGYIKLNSKELGYENEINKEIILYDYMAFLDKNIRGAINVIDFIKFKLLDTDFENLYKEKKENGFRFLKELLNVIILSNQEFILNENLINNVINLSQYNKELESSTSEYLNFNGYINYYAIISAMNKSIKGKDVMSKNKFDTYYDIFMLANLFEIFIIVLNLRENDNDNEDTDINLERIHGLNEYIKIVNKIRRKEKIKVLPDVKEDSYSKLYLKESICIKQNIFKSLRYNEIQQLFKDEESGYLESIYIDSFNHKGDVSTYIAKTFDEDIEWSKNIIDWIFANAPSDDGIKKFIVRNLEKRYKCNIGVYNTLNLGLSNYQCINFSSKRAGLEEKVYISKPLLKNISQSINDYIDTIDNIKIIESLIIEIEEKITDKKKNILNIKEEISKIDLGYDKDLELEKIIRIVDLYKEFLNNEINKEAWRSINKNLLIKDLEDNDLIDRFNFIDNMVIIDIKKELESLNINMDSQNIKKKYIIIRDCNSEDIDKKDFIREYYTKEKIIDILIKEHPISKLKSNEEYLKKLEKDLEEMEMELDSKKLLKDAHEEILNKNCIHKYIVKRVGSEDYKISNDKIINYIKECIEILIKNYDEREDKKYKFESLLNYFYKSINNIKYIDRNIAQLISVDTVNWSEERIDSFKVKLNDIVYDVTNEDIKNIREDIINDEEYDLWFESDNKRKKNLVRLSRLLEDKEIQIKDEKFILRKDIFKYAFYRTLNMHLNYQVDYEKKQMNSKVRTVYLTKKRQELLNISDTGDFISLQDYLNEKYN